MFKISMSEEQALARLEELKADLSEEATVKIARIGLRVHSVCDAALDMLKVRKNFRSSWWTGKIGMDVPGMAPKAYEILKERKDDASTQAIAIITWPLRQAGLLPAVLNCLNEREGSEASKVIGHIGYTRDMSAAALKILEDRKDDESTKQITDIGLLVETMADTAMEVLLRRGDNKSVNGIANIAMNVSGMEKMGLNILHRCESDQATRWIGYIGRNSSEGSTLLAARMLIEREGKAKNGPEAELAREELHRILLSKQEGIVKLELVLAVSCRENPVAIGGEDIRELCQEAVDDVFSPEAIQPLRGNTVQWLRLRSVLVRAKNLVPDLQVNEFVRTEILGGAPKFAPVVRP